MNLLLTTLIVLSLRIGLAEVVEQGRRLATGQPATIAEGDLPGPAIVSPTALLIAVVLAVFKPWGRIRKRDVAPTD